MRIILLCWMLGGFSYLQASSFSEELGRMERTRTLMGQIKRLSLDTQGSAGHDTLQRETQRLLQQKRQQALDLECTYALRQKINLTHEVNPQNILCALLKANIYPDHPFFEEHCRLLLKYKNLSFNDLEERMRLRDAWKSMRRLLFNQRFLILYWFGEDSEKSL